MKKQKGILSRNKREFETSLLEDDEANQVWELVNKMKLQAYEDEEVINLGDENHESLETRFRIRIMGINHINKFEYLEDVCSELGREYM